MIWDAHIEVDVVGSDPLASHISAEIAAAGVRPVTPDAACRQTAAAEAVAGYLRGHAERETFNTSLLLLLTARALWAAGDPAAARRLCEYGRLRFDFAPQYAEAAFAGDADMRAWGAFCASRAVRPAVFSSLGGVTLWILDVCRLSDGSGGLEMALCRAVQAALERVAVVWDSSGGQGALGLSRARKAAAQLLAVPEGSRLAGALADELSSYSLACLRDIGRSRGWRTAPLLVGLDLN